MLGPTLSFGAGILAIGGNGSHPNSVAVREGLVAVAVEAPTKTDSGKVVFFDTNGAVINSVDVGPLPDMLTFTPKRDKVLVANEGEPNDSYTFDPEGSVSIIDISRGASNANVVNATFTAFNSRPIDADIRIFGPGATVAQDLEPEFIAVSPDGKRAWVSLQENNAIAILDIDAGVFTDLVPLGSKDHSSSGNKFDANDTDGINITNWPVWGMYQPDAIAAFQAEDGNTYLVMANEGDARAYPGFTEEAQVHSLMLDPVAFPNFEMLKSDLNLGRLTVTTANGDTDGDGYFDKLYVFGGRSFSIRRASGDLLWDSGDDFEQRTAALFPTRFNANNNNNGPNTFDSRSDNKGPEPEGLVIGKVFAHTYAFIALERIGGIMVYELSDPSHPEFVRYVNNRDFSVSAASCANPLTPCDLGPEGLVFIRGNESPNGKPLLVVSSEVSGTTTIYEISKAD
jgi:hypothetical protein